MIDVEPQRNTVINDQAFRISSKNLSGFEGGRDVFGAALCAAGVIRGMSVVYDITSRTCFDRIEAHVIRIRPWSP